MMKRYLYGVFIAAAMLMSSVTLANPFVDKGIFDADPIYTPVATLAVNPPFAPVMKPNFDGFRRTATVGFFQFNSNQRMPTALACGYASKTGDVPTKVPIAL